MLDLPIDRSVAVLGTGSALPKRSVTNAELRELVSNYDDKSGDFAVWVDRVTHIQSRHFLDPETESIGKLALESSLRAIETAGIAHDEIDQVIFASFTYNDMFPGEHTWLVNELGIGAGTFNMTAACAGSLWAMTLARSLVQSGQCRNVLVIGAEAISRVVDWTDPVTAILFADASGAAVVGKKTDGEPTGFVGQSILRSEYAPGSITMTNANTPAKDNEPGHGERSQPREFLYMQGGPRVLRNAVNRMALAVVESLGFTGADLKADHPELRALLDRVRVIPHQANGRILGGLADKLGIPHENLYRTVYFSGNSSAATNMLTLDYAVREGNLRRLDPEPDSGKMGAIEPCGRTLEKGDLVSMVSIGAGYLYGAVTWVQAY